MYNIGIPTAFKRQPQHALVRVEGGGLFARPKDNSDDYSSKTRCNHYVRNGTPHSVVAVSVPVRTILAVRVRLPTHISHCTFNMFLTGEKKKKKMYLILV